MKNIENEKFMHNPKNHGTQGFKSPDESLISHIHHRVPFMFRLSLIALLLIQITGCASVLSDNQQTITVHAVCRSTALPAVCSAENRRGNWSFMASETVVISTDMTDLQISCKSPYFEETAASVSAVPNMAMLGNVVLGGVIGAAMDVANASGLRYPETIYLTNPDCER